MIVPIVVLAFFGFHKHHVPPTPHPVVVFDYSNVLGGDLTELETASDTYPWLKHWINPAIDLNMKLMMETGSEPGYGDDMDQLYSDIRLVRSLELNDTI